jgi:hypothetical protein
MAMAGQPRDPETQRWLPDHTATKRELDVFYKGISIGLSVASLIVFFMIFLALAMK